MSASIVCGVDGSREAGRAAAIGARLARDLGSRAVLVHVREIADEPRVGLRLPSPGQARRRRRLLRAAAAEFGFPRYTRFQLRTGDPTIELLTTVRVESAQLLVISTGGLGTASPVLLGGTASALIRASPCPVVVTPARSIAPRDADGMRHVVCAVEGRPCDAAVLDLAADLAARLGGDLHAVSTGDELGGKALGVNAAVHIVRSPVDEAIRRVADEQGAGLAVVGPPEDSRPSSWLNVPSTIALAAAGDVPVVVLTEATELHASSGYQLLPARRPRVTTP